MYPYKTIDWCTVVDTTTAVESCLLFFDLLVVPKAIQTQLTLSPQNSPQNSPQQNGPQNGPLLLWCVPSVFICLITRNKVYLKLLQKTSLSSLTQAFNHFTCLPSPHSLFLDCVLLRYQPDTNHGRLCHPQKEP